MMIHLQVSVVSLLAFSMFPSVGLQGQEEANQTTQLDQQSVERLVAEMQSIIPTKYDEGSDERRLLREVAVAFLERKATKMMTLLDELTTKDASMPPKNLILAGVSFATNNLVQGRN